MNKRNYNVFFNIHTVSGIVISVALYIIFFAGAFALFKDEIKLWEEGKPLYHIEKKNIDIDRILENLDKKYILTGRDLQITLGHKSNEVRVFIGAQKDSINNKKDLESKFLFINTQTLEEQSYEEQYGLGEFLYRLHYFNQIPIIGLYLAGFVALFFLFAIVTGVIVHWRKIISNFYQFNPKTTLKRIWTDAHTALGIIGLPFQFVFAITGAYFGIGILVLLPATLLYNGSQEKLIEDLRPARKKIKWVAKSTKEIPSFNAFSKQTSNTWNDFTISRGFIKNYGGTNMKYIITGELNDKIRHVSIGRISFDANSGKIEGIKNPNELNYIEDSQRLLGRLHFGNFGGFWVRIIYFILSFITCFVIITGVLIWMEARNKKSMTLKQRLYTAKIGHIYLAICLSMFPITALSFLLIKFLPEAYMTKRMSILYSFYFISWLIATIYLRYKRNNYFTNKICLLTGAILGILIPIANGVVSKNWVWNAYKNKQLDILSVDLLWVILSITAFLIYLKINPSIKNNSAFTKFPIDYKNRKILLKEENKPSLLVETKSTNKNLKNEIPMKIKIVILWIFLGIGWIVHHIYGLFNIYYIETLIMDGATGKAPLIHHIYRILFEGSCLFFGLLTIEISKKWFKTTSFAWAIIAGLYNVYHFFEALFFESTNISEIFMLALVTLANVFLLKNLWFWKNQVS